MLFYYLYICTIIVSLTRLLRCVYSKMDPKSGCSRGPLRPHCIWRWKVFVSPSPCQLIYGDESGLCLYYDGCIYEYIMIVSVMSRDFVCICSPGILQTEIDRSLLGTYTFDLKLTAFHIIACIEIRRYIHTDGYYSTITTQYAALNIETNRYQHTKVCPCQVRYVDTRTSTIVRYRSSSLRPR